MAVKLYFICCTLFSLHKFKMAANMFKTYYNNYITIAYVVHIHIHLGSHI